MGPAACRSAGLGRAVGRLGALVAPVLLATLMQAMTAPVSAQVSLSQPNPFFRPSRPAAESLRGIDRRGILDSDGSIPDQGSAEGETPQIAIQTHALRLSPEDYQAVYQSYGQDNLATYSQFIGRPPEAVSTAAQSAGMTVDQPARLTTMTMTGSVVREILQRYGPAQRTADHFAPAVIVLSGVQASANDQIDRPFLVGFDTSVDPPSPKIEVVRTGSMVHVIADAQRSDDALDLTVQWNHDRIVSVDEDWWFHAGTDPRKIQTPRILRVRGQASTRLADTHWLWFDPHLRIQPPTRNKRESVFRLTSTKRSPEQWVYLIRATRVTATAGSR